MRIFKSIQSITILEQNMKHQNVLLYYMNIHQNIIDLDGAHL